MLIRVSRLGKKLLKNEHVPMQDLVLYVAIVGSFTGFLVDLMAFRPGFMSPDSLDQYQQGLAHSYKDWHPPIMAALWGLLSRVYHGPLTMLVLQLACLWCSFGLLLMGIAKRHRFFALLLIPVFFSPFVQNFAGVIWKDVQMSFSWLLALGLILPALLNKEAVSPYQKWLSLLLLAYGCWVRTNAPPALLPLAVLWMMACTSRELNWKKQLARGAGLTVIIVGAGMLITHFILRPEKTLVSSKLFVQDAWAIGKETGEDLLPGIVHWADPRLDSSGRHYPLESFDMIWFLRLEMPLKRLYAPDVNKICQDAWWHAVKKHPGTYFRLRAKGFLHVLQIRPANGQVYHYFPWIVNNPYSIEYKPGKFGQAFYYWMNSMTGNIVFKPWLWLLLNVLILVISFFPRFRDIRVILQALNWSAFLYTVLLFFVYPTDLELRYFYWNSIAVSLSFVLAIGEWWRIRRQRLTSPS